MRVSSNPVRRQAFPRIRFYPSLMGWRRDSRSVRRTAGAILLPCFLRYSRGEIPVRSENAREKDVPELNPHAYDISVIESVLNNKSEQL